MKKEEIEEKYKLFIDDINVNLGKLEKVLQEYYGKDYKLTYTEESMHKIEAFLDQQLKEYNITLFSLEHLVESIGTYMGETVRRIMNGTWELERQEDVLTFGYPRVTKLDGLPAEGGYVPHHSLARYIKKLKKGQLAKSVRMIIYANDPSKW